MRDKVPGTRKSATIRDVAREAGVSIAAVSYTINGGGTIGEEMRARVREVAERLGYRPNRAARATRTGRTMTMGLVVPDLNNPYYPALAQSFERAARQAGYNVVLIDTAGQPDEEDEAIRQLEDQGVAGMVWCQTSRQVAPPADGYSIPVVVIGAPDPNLDTVTADDRTGGRLAAQHLLAAGHRRIGLLSGAVPEEKDDRRIEFLATIGIEAEIVWRLTTPYGIDLSEKVLETLGRREVTAVMCGNDLIAIGVLRGARQLGIVVPDDLSVIGFDDIPWASIVTPPLTTINQPVAEMAAVALTLLLDRIAEPERPVRHFKVGVSLVARESVARIGAEAESATPMQRQP